MYPNNIYVKNHEAIKKITFAGKPCDVSVQLDIFDERNGLKHDDRLRAQYMHFLGIPMSVEYEKLLRQ